MRRLHHEFRQVIPCTRAACALIAQKMSGLELAILALLAAAVAGALVRVLVLHTRIARRARELESELASPPRRRDRARRRVPAICSAAFAERTQALEARNEELTRLRFALETANRRLKHLVGVDALTGIANRRHFDRALEREVRRARRDAQPLSLVFLDLDEFKLFNDSYGHTRGDEVLRKVAQTLDETFRRGGDLVARYGGEEFAVVLPGVDGRRAGLYAERLRRRIWRLAIPYNASQLTRPGHDQRRRRDRLPARQSSRPTTCCSRRTKPCTARNAWAATASPPPKSVSRGCRSRRPRSALTADRYPSSASSPIVAELERSTRQQEWGESHD